MSADPVRPTRVRALLAAAGFAVVALVAAGCASTVSGTGSFGGGDVTDGPTTKASSTSRSASRSADFPDRTTSSTRTTSSSTTSSSTRSSSTTPRTSSAAPSTSSTADLALKQQLADIGQRWVHAYGNGDVATFCALSDPPSLQAVLDEKGITSCSTLTITWDTDKDLQAQLKAFAIPNPADILVIIDNAFVLSFDTTPEDLNLGLSWIKQADGSWKVDASILSSN